MGERMKCKNCGHEIGIYKEKPKKGEKGTAYFYVHSDAIGRVMRASHASFCDCVNPEPEKEAKKE